ncbi:RIP metalloprotease RseP [Desulfovibrio sp. OttesenSCG-928-A18]|nr:RIP metalloprotease RseP [Desulfovibrio sp. OttesenSCG-928-A18]
MSGVIAVILVFGGLIFFHELGHFIVARVFSMGVKTFSLGFGPVLFRFKRGKTSYQLAALPLGGFVSLVGESADAEIPEEFSKEESFALRPAWQRFMVIAAGPVFNLVLAWLICWGLMWTSGREFTPPVVGEIIEDTPAAASPLEPGDRILTINGAKIGKFREMPRMLQESKEQELLITAQRKDGTLLSFVITPEFRAVITPDGKEEAPQWGIGIRSVKSEFLKFGFLEAAREGVVEAGNMVVFTWNALRDLVTRKVSFSNVGGPVLIVQAIHSQADHGLINVLLLAALISVNLGLLNLLPIPVLDGGHLIFLLVEMIGRRPVPVYIQEKAMIVGLFLLVTLMAAATFNDVMRLLT